LRKAQRVGHPPEKKRKIRILKTAGCGTPLRLRTDTPSKAKEKRDRKSKGKQETFEQILSMPKDVRPAKESLLTWLEFEEFAEAFGLLAGDGDFGGLFVVHF
jgi:hypothetical protein